MKRAVTIFAIALLSVAITPDLVAQSFGTYRAKRSWGSAELSGSYTMGGSQTVDRSYGAGVDLTAGYDLFPHLGLGIGLGLNRNTGVALTSMPYFGEARIWLRERTSPLASNFFLYGRYGGAQIFKVSTGTGTTAGAGVGTTLRTQRTTLLFKAGYQYQRYLYLEQNNSRSIRCHSVSVSAGVMF